VDSHEKVIIIALKKRTILN